MKEPDTQKEESNSRQWLRTCNALGVARSKTSLSMLPACASEDVAMACNNVISSSC